MSSLCCVMLSDHVIMFSLPSIKIHTLTFTGTQTLEHTRAKATFHHIHHPAPIDMDIESRLPYFLWSRSRSECGLLLFESMC